MSAHLISDLEMSEMREPMYSDILARVSFGGRRMLRVEVEVRALYGVSIAMLVGLELKCQAERSHVRFRSGSGVVDRSKQACEVEEPYEDHHRVGAP